MFLRGVVELAVRRTRSLMHQMRKKKTEDSSVQAEGEAKEDLVWWLEGLRNNTSFSLKAEPVSATLATDASDYNIWTVLES